jgi:hypothetical protein
VVSTGTAYACSCVSPSAYTNEESLAELLRDADVVVYAKVKAKRVFGRASIQVIELFKGPSDLRVLKAKGGASASCGTGFSVSEEVIFISHDGVVSVCGKVPPDPLILKALRRHSQLEK